MHKTALKTIWLQMSHVPTLRKPGPSPPGLDSTALAGACVEQLLVLPGALRSPHSWRRPSATPSTPAPAQEVGPQALMPLCCSLLKGGHGLSASSGLSRNDSLGRLECQFSEEGVLGETAFGRKLVASS